MTPTPDQPFTITRSFSAPLAAVWQAWSDPAQFAQWWGPRAAS